MIMTCENCNAEDDLEVYDYEVLCKPCMKRKIKAYTRAGFIVIGIYTIIFIIGQRILK